MSTLFKPRARQFRMNPVYEVLRVGCFWFTRVLHDEVRHPVYEMLWT